MSARRLLSVLSIGAVLAWVPIGAAVAVGQDHGGHPDTRNCVSLAEYRTVHHTMFKAALERKWEVRGEGVVGPTPDARHYERLYPACGFPEGQLSLTCYVGVLYRAANDKAIVMWRWHSTGAHPIGPHRTSSE